MAACARAASASSNSWPTTGRSRPAAASASADLAVLGEVRGDRGEAAAGHAERAEPAARTEQAERRQPGVPAHAVEHHVHLAGQVADLPFPAVVAVVDGHVRAEVPG